MYKHKVWAIGLYMLVVVGGAALLHNGRTFANQIPAGGTPSIREELSVPGGGLTLNAPVSYYSLFSNTYTFSFQFEQCVPDQTSALLATESCTRGTSHTLTDGNHLMVLISCDGSANSWNYNSVTTPALGTNGTRNFGTAAAPFSCGAGATKDPASGMYRVTVELCLSTANARTAPTSCAAPAGPQIYGFRITSTGTTLVGYDGRDTVSHPFAQQYRGSSCGISADNGSAPSDSSDCYSDYDIDFEGACNNSAGTRGNIDWQDADGWDSASPQNWSINFTVTGGGNNLKASGKPALPPGYLYRTGGQGRRQTDAPLSVALPPDQTITWGWNSVLYSNGVQFWVPASSVAPNINCNKSPTGTLSIDCTASGVGWAAMKFGDPDGATTAQLKVTFATGSTPSTATYNIPSSYSSSGATTWNSFVIPTPGPPPGGVPGPNGSATTPALPGTPAAAAYFNGNWSAQLVINDVPSGSPVTKSDTANCAAAFSSSCIPAGFTGAGTLTPGVAYSFSVATKRNAAPLPGGFAFTVTVVDLGSGVSMPVTVSGVPSVSGTTVTSGQYGFTPTAGHYEVRWTATAETNPAAPCTHALDVGYQSFFSTQGGDIAAGTGYADDVLGCPGTGSADIKGSNTNNPLFAGANGRLGAMATGDITGFPSGLALTGVTPPALSGHGLSFANAGAGVGITASLGQYGGSFGGTLPCQPDYFSGMPSSATALGTTITSFAGMNAVNYHATTGGLFYLGAAADLNASPTNTLVMSASQQVNLYVQGNVLITDDVLYLDANPANAGSHTYGSIKDIPRFNLYVKGNVYISPHVHNLEGVYIAQQDSGSADPGATGIINTCADGAGTWSASDYYTTCKLNNAGDAFSLKVTGVLSAENKLELTRSYGNLVSGAGLPPVQPAELFEYNPEMWLTTGTARIDSYTGLPPVL